MHKQVKLKILCDDETATENARKYATGACVYVSWQSRRPSLPWRSDPSLWCAEAEMHNSHRRRAEDGRYDNGEAKIKYKDHALREAGGIHACMAAHMQRRARPANPFGNGD